MSISELQKKIHKNALDKGFWDDKDNPLKIPTMLALVGTEVSEAVESHRKNLDNFGEELADIVIRVLDIAEAYGVNLEDEISRKTQANKSRPRMHGGKRY